MDVLEASPPQQTPNTAKGILGKMKDGASVWKNNSGSGDGRAGGAGVAAQATSAPGN